MKMLEKTTDCTERDIIQESIKRLQERYQTANTEIFGGALPKCVIIIAPTAAAGMRAKGWATSRPIWKSADSEEVEYYEIAITAETIARTHVDITGTLLHEMVHIYNAINDIQDCSNRGRYHNRNFALAARRIGLDVKKVSPYGFCETSISDELAAILPEAWLKVEPFAPIFRNTKGRTNKPRKPRKFVKFLDETTGATCYAKAVPANYGYNFETITGRALLDELDAGVVLKRPAAGMPQQGAANCEDAAETVDKIAASLDILKTMTPLRHNITTHKED